MIVQDRNGKLEEYLQLLRSMAFELERAMSAISENSVRGLENSLANQEAFSTRLVELADDLSRPRQQEPLTVRGAADDTLLERVHAASNELQSLNRRYAALLSFPAAQWR